jgi:hypothetical protein
MDFLAEARNSVLVGRNGLGKTTIAQKYLPHRCAGYSLLFGGLWRDHPLSTDLPDLAERGFDEPEKKPNAEPPAPAKNTGEEMTAKQ